MISPLLIIFKFEEFLLLSQSLCSCLSLHFCNKLKFLAFKYIKQLSSEYNFLYLFCNCVFTCFLQISLASLAFSRELIDFFKVVLLSGFDTTHQPSKIITSGFSFN